MQVACVASTVALVATHRNVHEITCKRSNELTSVAAGHLLRTTFQLLSKEDFEARTGTKAPAGKRYFQHRRLADIVGAYPLPEVRFTYSTVCHGAATDVDYCVLPTECLRSRHCRHTCNQHHH